MDELDSMELQLLRQQALNTQKHNRRLPTATAHEQILGSSFPVDEFLKSQRNKKAAADLSQEMMDTLVTHVRRAKRPHPSSSHKDAKRSRRISSASSSHSSYSSSSSRSPSHSPSRSSYSTSHSSSASSRSSSYSNSHSYTRSSGSSRSRSHSPNATPAASTAPRTNSRKVRSSNYLDKLGQPYHKSSDVDKHRLKAISPHAQVSSRSSRGGREYINTRGASPRQDWYRSSLYEKNSTKSHRVGSERRSQQSGGVLSSSDRYHKSPPPPSSSHRRQRDYLHDNESCLRGSSSGSWRPRDLPPPPLSPRGHHRSSALHSPPHHRHPSPSMRERRVVSRRSPPPPPPPSHNRAPSSRDRYNDRARRPLPGYPSPQNRHRRSLSRSPPPPPRHRRSLSRSPPPLPRARRNLSRSPPPPPRHRRSLSPPLSSSRYRRLSPLAERERMRPRSGVRGRERAERRTPPPPRRDEGRSVNVDLSYRQRSPDPRDRRDPARRDRDSNNSTARISKRRYSAGSESEGERSRGKDPGATGEGRKDNRQSSRKTSSVVLSVLDSVSPKRKANKIEALNGASAEEKESAEKMLSENYEFNAFVEELDYDENMEEVVAQPDQKSDTNEEGQDDDGDDGAEEQELVEVSSAGSVRSESPSSAKQIDPVSPEDISSDSDSGEKGVAISSPIRVTPDRDSRSRRDRKGRRKGAEDKDVRGKKLSVKDRLFVSKKTIEKRKTLGSNTKYSDSLRPSLANRLGPSPHDRRNVSSKRFVAGSQQPKGSAVEIAEAYRRKKREEEKLLREEEKQKAKKMAKIISQETSRKTSSRKLSPIGTSDTVDKERALDQRIDRIKQNNRALERRKQEVEKDKQLYG